jgi:tetratricopeptide (TPR) repeat protein
LAICEGQLGSQHPVTAEVLTNLAELYRDQCRYEQAEPLFARALVIQEHALTANHPDIAKTLHGFAGFHAGQGTLQTAAVLYRRALTIREHVYSQHHPKTSETRENLQAVLHRLQIEGKEV